MAFADYVRQQGGDSTQPVRFDHSSATLPQYLHPSPQQAAELAAAAEQIAHEIAPQFDAEHERQTALLNDLNRQEDAYWQAPVPIGAMRIAPPLSLHQQVITALSDLVATCQRFMPDAMCLAKAGAPQLRAYIQTFLDDETKALGIVKNMSTSMYATSPANYGAGPGPDPNFPALFGPGAQPPMGPPMGGGWGWPALPPMPQFPPMGQLPFGGGMPFPPPLPPMPPFPGGGPMGPPFGGMPFAGGPMPPPTDAGLSPDAQKALAETDQSIIDSMQRIHEGWQKTFDETNKKFEDYLKS